MLRFLIAAVVMLIQGCASPPPKEPTGPAAIVADSATGGGNSGAAFFMLTEANGESISPGILESSLAASRGKGTRMEVRQVERKVPAGRSKLKLVGRFAYAAPIQTIFGSKDSYAVEGTIDVDLRPDARYRVAGVLDAFKREIWLEDMSTGEVVGGRIANTAAVVATEGKPGGAEVFFTCCNLHYEDDWISDANWSTLPFVPAGAAISVQEYGRHRAQVTIEGRPMRLGHDYGRGKETKEQFVARLLVKDDPKVRLAAYSAQVQAAIRAGRVMLGMTKEQVIMSLGYPRADVTPSTNLPEWTYWTRDDEPFVIVWGGDGRVKEIDATRDVKRQVVQNN